MEKTPIDIKLSLYLELSTKTKNNSDPKSLSKTKSHGQKKISRYCSFKDEPLCRKGWRREVRDQREYLNEGE